MLQTIIAVLVLSAGVIALSRLTVLYYTKKRIEEAKEDLKPSDRVKKADSDERLIERYKQYRYLVGLIKTRVRFKINEDVLVMDNTYNEKQGTPYGMIDSMFTISTEINHDGWVTKSISNEFGLLYYDKFKLDADWLIDNDEGFTDSLHEVLRTLAEKGYGE